MVPEKYGADGFPRIAAAAASGERFRSRKRRFPAVIQTFVSSDVTRSSRVISGTYKRAFQSITLRQDLILQQLLHWRPAGSPTHPPLPHRGAWEEPLCSP